MSCSDGTQPTHTKFIFVFAVHYVKNILRHIYDVYFVSYVERCMFNALCSAAYSLRPFIDVITLKIS